MEPPWWRQDFLGGTVKGEQRQPPLTGVEEAGRSFQYPVRVEQGLYFRRHACQRYYFGRSYEHHYMIGRQGQAKHFFMRRRMEVVFRQPAHHLLKAFKLGDVQVNNRGAKS